MDLERHHRIPGEIKRSRDLRGGRWSWTLTFAQKRSWVGRWSWAEQVGRLLLWVVQVVRQQRCNGHCLSDSVQHSSWKSNCAVHKSLGTGGYCRSAVWRPCGAALQNKSVVCSGSRVTNSTVMKLHEFDNRGGIAVKTHTKSTCSQARPGLHRSRPPSTPHHRLHSCGPAVQTHTSTPTAGGPRAHQGPAGTEGHRREPQSVSCTSGHRPQERRRNPPLRRLSQVQCKDSWWCLSSSEDPRVFWWASRGPVLFDTGPGQRLPSNCHASRWPAQDGLRDADGPLRIHQNADGSVIGASDLPTPYSVHDVRLHLPVPAGVPGRSAGVLQDVWRAPCPPGPSSAAHHRRWSEAEDGQVPVSTTPGPLLGAHHLRWGRQLRGREGGSCEELAGAGDHYCSAQRFGLRQLLSTLHPGLLEDCWSPPWPGRQGQCTSQEERGRHLQAMRPAAPEGVRKAEDNPDYSSCPGVCRVHQAVHPRDRRQPWRAECHPLSRSRWAEKGLGLRKSTAACHREEPGQLLKWATTEKFRHYLLGA